MVNNSTETTTEPKIIQNTMKREKTTLTSRKNDVGAFTIQKFSKRPRQINIYTIVYITLTGNSNLEMSISNQRCQVVEVNDVLHGCIYVYIYIYIKILLFP